MNYSRRRFGELAITSLPLATVAFSDLQRMMAATRPDSMFNGVQIGVIALYSYK